MESIVANLDSPSGAVIAVVVAGCVIFAILMALSDDKKPLIARFSRNITNFMVPLLVIFGFLFIMWVARILV